MRALQFLSRVRGPHRQGPFPHWCRSARAVAVGVFNALERVRVHASRRALRSCTVPLLPFSPFPHPHGAGDHSIQYVLHRGRYDVVSYPGADLFYFPTVPSFVKVAIRCSEVVPFVCPVECSWHAPVLGGDQGVVCSYI